MRGCTQRHFPAVAQPFKVLWAPWPLAATGIALALTISIFCMIVFGAAVGGILLPLTILGFHGTAIGLGLKLRYAATMVTSLDNRKTGSSNLSPDKSGYEFANI